MLGFPAPSPLSCVVFLLLPLLITTTTTTSIICMFRAFHLQSPVEPPARVSVPSGYHTRLIRGLVR